MLNWLKNGVDEKQKYYIFAASAFNFNLVSELLHIGVSDVLTKLVSLDKLDKIKRKYLNVQNEFSFHFKQINLKTILVMYTYPKTIIWQG